MSRHEQTHTGLFFWTTILLSIVLVINALVHLSDRRSIAIERERLRELERGIEQLEGRVRQLRHDVRKVAEHDDRVAGQEDRTVVVPVEYIEGPLQREQSPWLFPDDQMYRRLDAREGELSPVPPSAR